MVKFGLVLGFAAVGAASSFGALNLDLNENYKSTLLPNTGSVNLTFSGKVDILLPGYDIIDGFLEFPRLTPTGAALAVSYVPAFLTYANAANPGVDYNGDIFIVTVSSTDATGEYFYNNTEGTDFAEFSLTASNGTFSSTDVEMFGVDVNAVPEPASMAVLGLGAVALLRRKRK
ncbi:MAG TPA: PEP-CTERM sorting domain-containing protein [Fimbriimonas sp.]|nr:PEP-CTERM sorting domain-containing protein [Fimbriimonas sp.]